MDTIIIIILIPNKKRIFVHSINMPNPEQKRQGQNELEIQNLLQNGIKQITRTQNLAKDDYQIKKNSESITR